MEDRIVHIKSLLDNIIRYNRMIIADNFEPDTVEDMKGNAKAICDEIKSEADNIKDEINLWS